MASSLFVFLGFVIACAVAMRFADGGTFSLMSHSKAHSSTDCVASAWNMALQPEFNFQRELYSQCVIKGKTDVVINLAGEFLAADFMPVHPKMTSLTIQSANASEPVVLRGSMNTSSMHNTALIANNVVFDFNNSDCTIEGLTRAEFISCTFTNGSCGTLITVNGEANLVNNTIAGSLYAYIGFKITVPQHYSNAGRYAVIAAAIHGNKGERRP